MKKIIIIFALSFLVGCGGSDSSPEPPPPPPPPPASEGYYGYPLNLGTTSNIIIHSGSISADGISYYKFTTTYTDSYFIATFNATSRLTWIIYLPGEPAFTICNPSISDPLTSACFTPVLNPNTTYHVTVLELNGAAGTFTLGIQNSIIEYRNSYAPTLQPEK